MTALLGMLFGTKSIRSDIDQDVGPVRQPRRGVVHFPKGVRVRRIYSASSGAGNLRVQYSSWSEIVNRVSYYAL
jgi:hypothetical protein